MSANKQVHQALLDSEAQSSAAAVTVRHLIATIESTVSNQRYRTSSIKLIVLLCPDN